MIRVLSHLALAWAVFSALVVLEHATLSRASAPLPDSTGQDVTFFVTGSRVGRLVGLDAGGASRVWAPRESARPTLLFVFSAGCSACDRILPYWSRLAEWVEPEPGGTPLADVLCANTDGEGGASFLEPFGLDTRVLDVDLSALHWPKAAAQRRLRTTPQTLLVNARGIVEKVRVGSWADEELDDWLDAITVVSVGGSLAEPGQVPR